MVRIFVGDSGAGIVNTILAAYRATPGEGAHRKGSVAEEYDALEFAFSPLGTRHLNANKAGARGLARTLRLVKEYEGAIVARTSRAELVYGFPERTEIVAHSGSRLAEFPGTSFEVLLPALRRSRRRTDAKESARPTDVRPKIVPTTARDIDALETTLLEALAEGPKRQVAVILPTDGDTMTGRQMEELGIKVAQLSAIVEESALVVLWMPERSSAEAAAIFPVVDEARETGTSAQLEAARIGEASGVYLVCAGVADLRFYGGTTEVRGILYRASENDGQVPREDEQPAAEIVRRGRPGAAWIEEGEEGLRLRLTLPEVAQSLRLAAMREVTRMGVDVD